MVNIVDRTAFTDTRVYGGKMPGGKPEGIILHHTGSSNEAGDEAWLSEYHPNPVSTNQLVRRDGTIIQIVPNDTVAYHAGLSRLNGRDACNLWCVGIEICNRGDGQEAYTEEQIEAVSQSVAALIARYGILAANVATHAQVALPPGRKVDPLGWPMDRMWKRVHQIQGAPPPVPVPVPSGPPVTFSVPPGSPYTAQMGGAIGDFWKANPNALRDYGWPMQNERARVLEDGRTYTTQVCERVMLHWLPGEAVGVARLGAKCLETGVL